MARKAIQKDQIVKLIVGAGQASPSPPVGPALGSKGVKSMDFCKVGHFSTFELQHASWLTRSHPRNSMLALPTSTPVPLSPLVSPSGPTDRSLLSSVHQRQLISYYKPPMSRRGRVGFGVR